MEHNLFKPKNLEEGKHAVVGDCNGFSMEHRWKHETPAFAKMIAKYIPEGGSVLDYGCGVGRLAKEILAIRPDVTVYGVDASPVMVQQSISYVNNLNFTASLPEKVPARLKNEFDCVYCVYVLQHCPAIDLRDSIQRIYHLLKRNGSFVYCSSDYRMCIRFDDGGFFDDRFLGVNIRDEVERLFNVDRQLFFPEDIAQFNPETQEVLNKMIFDPGLPHPAYVYSKKDSNSMNFFDLTNRHEFECKKPIANVKTIVTKARQMGMPKGEPNTTVTINGRDAEKVVFVNDLSPGDVLLTSIAIRSLHMAHPDQYITDMRSPCNELFDNNIYITKITHPNPNEERRIIEELKKNEHLGPITSEGITYIIAHYPEIHRSGMSGLSFTDGHRLFAAKQLEIDIPATGMAPDFIFGELEISKYFNEINPFKQLRNRRYWVINAGSKNDFTLKQWHRYQEVVNSMPDVTFVQIGHTAHNHAPLENVIDLRGQTNLRHLAAIIHESDGVLTPISLPMHLAAAFEKPCVVIAGAREGTRWELYPNQRYLCFNGSMSCAPTNGDGCWKSKLEECTNKDDDGYAKCMSMIEPYMVTDAINSYYDGGRINNSKLQIRNIVLPTCNIESSNCDIKLPIVNDEVLQYRSPQITAAIFNTLRILKGVTPEDTYYEAYMQHYAKRGTSFMDTYHFMWYLGSVVQPKRILEIGCRTGVSICQFLSATIRYGDIEHIDLCDIFAEPPACAEVVEKNLRAINIPEGMLKKIYITKIDSHDFMNHMILENKEYDYILVDGCHEKEHALIDLRYATKLISVGGYIVFDDITEDGCSLQDVWDKFKKENDGSFIFWENHDGKGIAYAKKVKR